MDKKNLHIMLQPSIAHKEDTMAMAEIEEKEPNRFHILIETDHVETVIRLERRIQKSVPFRLIHGIINNISLFEVFRRIFGSGPGDGMGISVTG